jgi:hypothetical protein
MFPWIHCSIVVHWWQNSTERDIVLTFRGGGGVLSFYFYIMKFGGYYFCRRLKNYYISQRRALYVVFLWKGKDMHFDHLSSIVNILVFARMDEF